MEELLNKAQLLDKMHSEYTAFQMLLNSLDETQMTTAGENGDWSIKDILAHIATWQKHLLDRLEAAAHNQEPAVPVQSLTDEEIDRLNEQFYQENKSRPFAEVLTDFRSTYLQIVKAMQTISDTDLTDPHCFAWMGGSPLLRLVAGDTYEHYQEHIGPIQEWLAKTGKV